MTRVASSHAVGAELQARAKGPSNGPASSNGLDEVLNRFQNEIDAVAVGISIGDGSLSKNVSRSESAGRLLAQVWEYGAAGLMEQARSSPGPIGTNKLRGVADGPVCGKLIAAALRDSGGAMTGLVIALRTVDQEKFTQKESQRLTELALEVVVQLSHKEPEPPAGLMSWSVFEERATAQERVSTVSGCVLYGNVDQLHVLNKLAGFAAGDRAIAAVGEVVQSEKLLPPGAGACHLSGDRFTVYLPATALPQGRKIAETLCRAVSDRCAKLDGLRTKLSISFGVALIPESDSGVTQALAAAEAACRAAKDRGRGRVEVYQDTDQSIVRRNDDVVIAGRLRKALESQRFALVAQPLFRLQESREPDCFEILVRFEDETGLLGSPTPFISAAKRYQLLTELDRAVITRVFERVLDARKQLEGQNVRFSINLSGPSLADTTFLEWLSSLIGPRGMPGEWVQFELSESAAIANVAQTQMLIQRLRSRGVEFALDDFGTGVSSFSYLRTFDVTMLKLDGSFTRDLLTDTRSEALVRGIAQLGHGMGIQTAAECVETQAVCDRLRELGIDRAQGFYFGQPLTFERILEPRPTEAQPLSPGNVEKILTRPDSQPTDAAAVVAALVEPAAEETSATTTVASVIEAEPVAALASASEPEAAAAASAPPVEQPAPQASAPTPSAESVADASVTAAPVGVEKASNSELEELAKSAEELHAQSQQLKLATEQLATPGERNDATVEQPMMAPPESDTVQQPLPHLSGMEPTVEQPTLSSMTATG